MELTVKQARLWKPSPTSHVVTIPHEYIKQGLIDPEKPISLRVTQEDKEEDDE